jgi:hypothetical protein
MRMKAYTRELREKAARDSQILTGDVTTLEKLSAACLERPSREHMWDVWNERRLFTTTPAQHRIVEGMLRKIEQGV